MSQTSKISRALRADRGPFNEGAAQVKKLLTRDKRELMGVEQIGQRARTEFDEEDSKPSTSGSENGSTSKENTRLFGEGTIRHSRPAICMILAGNQYGNDPG